MANEIITAAEFAARFPRANAVDAQSYLIVEHHPRQIIDAAQVAPRGMRAEQIGRTRHSNSRQTSRFALYPTQD